MESCFVFGNYRENFVCSHTHQEHFTPKYRPFANKIMNTFQLTEHRTDGKMSHCFLAYVILYAIFRFWQCAQCKCLTKLKIQVWTKPNKKFQSEQSERRGKERQRRQHRNKNGIDHKGISLISPDLSFCHFNFVNSFRPYPMTTFHSSTYFLISKMMLVSRFQPQLFFGGVVI